MLQQLPAFVVFQPAIGTLPFQQLAHGSGDLGYAQTGIVVRHYAHQLHFWLCECAPAKCHRDHGSPKMLTPN
jgi:hypothetical protein